MRETLDTAGGAWTWEDTPDHARRLLRRAENEDRPGSDVHRALSTACGHSIADLPQPVRRSGAGHPWCSLYEHTFLFADGGQVHLYELEHDLSGSGRLMCEVYLEQAHARHAAVRRRTGAREGQP